MKKSLLIISLILFVFSCSEEDIYIDGLSEETVLMDVIPEGETSTGEEIFMVVEESPAFPGGSDAYKEFIINNLKYPEEAIAQNIEGKVFLSFVVDKEGVISDIKVNRGLGYGCDEEAVKMLMKSPNWKPGVQRGRTVKTRMALAVNFKLR
uniref:energy transducer TonB n=1 Tax=Roseivirga sp. TaxID=1964215 RepID=UPI00404737FF